MILSLPFLMFQGRAQEAINLYLETFPGAELLELVHHPEGTTIQDPTTEGEDAGFSAQAVGAETATLDTVADWETPLVANAQLRIGGQVLMIQDSLTKHEFSFNPAISLSVVVDTAEEFSSITAALAASGSYLMEPGEYDFATNYAWIKDPFGVSWQIVQPRPAAGVDPESATASAPARAPQW